MTLEEMFCDLYDKYGKDFNRYMIPIAQPDGAFVTELKYSLQGTTQGRYLTGGVPPVRFSM